MKRPVTYQDWRKIFHEETENLGWLCAHEIDVRLGLKLWFGERSIPHEKWRRYRRVRRIESRLEAYFDAMGWDVCKEILRDVMDDPGDAA